MQVKVTSPTLFNFTRDGRVSTISHTIFFFWESSSQYAFEIPVDIDSQKIVRADCKKITSQRFQSINLDKNIDDMEKCVEILKTVLKNLNSFNAQKYHIELENIFKRYQDQIGADVAPIEKQ